MSGRVLVRVLVLVALCLGPASSAGAQGSAEIVAHPSELTYGPLDFELPDADGFRHELAGGVPAYLVPDRSLPLVDIAVRFRIGSWLEPVEQTGLASLTGELMRTGGAGELEAKAFDEAVEAVAGNFSAFIGSTSAGMSMNCLSTVLDECLDLFFSMLTEPRFDGDRLDLAKENELESLKQRNDDPVDVAGREGQWLLYGPDHVESRFVTAASLDAVGRDDLVAFHRRYVHPGHMVVGAAGDFDSDELAAKLSALLGRFEEEGREQAPWPPRASAYEPAPGVYVAQQDIPQGRVQIGHRTFQREDWGPSRPLRSGDDGRCPGQRRLHDALDEENPLGRGPRLRCLLQLRYRQLLARQSERPPSSRRARRWPSRRRSRSRRSPASGRNRCRRTSSRPSRRPRSRPSRATSNRPWPWRRSSPRTSSWGARTTTGALTGRNVEAVTPADVMRVAERHLLADRLVMLIVGDWEEIEPGDADGRATMAEVAGKIGGGITMLPARDPVSLEVVEQ